MNVKDIHLTPDQWVGLLTYYGVPSDSLTGTGKPCPACGGTDRFTYDNKRNRGDWVCRGCGDKGRAGAGDGFQLLCNVLEISFRDLMVKLEKEYFHLNVSAKPVRPTTSPAPAPKKEVDRGWIEHRLTTMWSRAKPLEDGDIGMRYLQARVPGLYVEPSKALRVGMLEYRHEKQLLGKFPGIVQRFVLPDGRLGTLHRTYLDPSKPAKAVIVSPDGEILDSKKNDKTLNKLNGGAVRLMDPINAEIAVAEGLENAYAGYMEFGVPAWNCLNRVLIRDFVVPEGLGIRVVHIYADFDEIDPKTKVSPGMVAALELQKRLKADGFIVILHRPKKRGTDFVDQWVAKLGAPALAAPGVATTRVPQRPALAA